MNLASNFEVSLNLRLHVHLRLAKESTQKNFISQLISFTGGYMYLEASLHTIGEKARLLSGYLTGTQCMRFKYHMMGPGIGTLRVHQITKKGSRPRVVWYRIGNQGEDWRGAQFNLFGKFYKVGLKFMFRKLQNWPVLQLAGPNLFGSFREKGCIRYALRKTPLIYWDDINLQHIH